MARRLWIVALLALGWGCSSPEPQEPLEPKRGRPPQARPEPEPEPRPQPEPVKAEVPNRSPVAKVTPSTVETRVGQEVSLDGSASSDPDGEVVAYTWRVGNGTPQRSMEPTFQHTFHEAGLQTILLTVEDDRGATAVYVVQAVVKD
ncbi:MAG: PKD domain-containing protein [Planctomycetota bacterium]